MNKLLSAIRSRLPGGKMHSRLRSTNYINSYQSSEPLIQIFRTIRKEILLAYFFGWGCPKIKRLKEIRYEAFMSLFQELYTDVNNPDRYDIKGTYMPKIADEVYNYTFTTEGFDFAGYYLLSNNEVCNATTQEGPYELGMVTIAENDIVIDAGANIGLFSAIASSKGATVYAFEPSKNIIDKYLSKTAAWNKNIHICEYGLSDKQGQLEFVEYTEEGLLGSSHIEMTDNSTENSSDCNTSGGGYRYKIDTISIDEFTQKNNLPRVDFIKADIEGAERYMLMGAKQVLKDFAPKIAICTYHLPDDPKVLRELILDANPDYVIIEKFKKMYAYVPKA